MKEPLPLLTCNEIHKSFYHPEKVHLLCGISLSVFPRESIAIIGASGEGKTTLLHILGTLETPDQGSLQILGKEYSKDEFPHIRNTNIGFIFQNYNLLEDFTTLDNVLMPARIARKALPKGGLIYNRGIDLLKQVGLEERAHFPAKILSGGERQRVTIARSLCNDPEIILADEPSGNLDHENSRQVHELLLTCVKKMNKSLIVVTHDEKLASLCDHRYLLQNGKLTLMDPS